MGVPAKEVQRMPMPELSRQKTKPPGIVERAEKLFRRAKQKKCGRADTTEGSGGQKKKKGDSCPNKSWGRKTNTWGWKTNHQKTKRGGTTNTKRGATSKAPLLNRMGPCSCRGRLRCKRGSPSGIKQCGAGIRKERGRGGEFRLISLIGVKLGRFPYQAAQIRSIIIIQKRAYAERMGRKKERSMGRRENMG